jgi:hypothetical protein
VHGLPFRPEHIAARATYNSIATRTDPHRLPALPYPETSPPTLKMTPRYHSGLDVPYGAQERCKDVRPCAHAFHAKRCMPPHAPQRASSVTSDTTIPHRTPSLCGRPPSAASSADAVRGQLPRSLSPAFITEWPRPSAHALGSHLLPIGPMYHLAAHVTLPCHCARDTPVLNF